MWRVVKNFVYVVKQCIHGINVVRPLCHRHEIANIDVGICQRRLVGSRIGDGRWMKRGLFREGKGLRSFE